MTGVPEDSFARVDSSRQRRGAAPRVKWRLFCPPESEMGRREQRDSLRVAWTPASSRSQNDAIYGVSSRFHNGGSSSQRSPGDLPPPTACGAAGCGAEVGGAASRVSCAAFRGKSARLSQGRPFEPGEGGGGHSKGWPEFDRRPEAPGITRLGWKLRARRGEGGIVAICRAQFTASMRSHNCFLTAGSNSKCSDNLADRCDYHKYPCCFLLRYL